MFIVKDGYIYVGRMITFALAIYWLFGLYWAIIPAVLALYFAYFFRDEHRALPNNSNLLYAPADAHVLDYYIITHLHPDHIDFDPTSRILIRTRIISY